MVKHYHIRPGYIVMIRGNLVNSIFIHQIRHLSSVKDYFHICSDDGF